MGRIDMNVIFWQSTMMTSRSCDRTHCDEATSACIMVIFERRNGSGYCQQESIAAGWLVVIVIV